MATTFIVMTGLKLAGMFGTGIAITTAVQYFHSFEFKPKKKKGDDENDISKTLNEKSRQIS